jgi:hypothetical protein
MNAKPLDQPNARANDCQSAGRIHNTECKEPAKAIDLAAGQEIKTNIIEQEIGIEIADTRHPAMADFKETIHATPGKSQQEQQITPEIPGQSASFPQQNDTRQQIKDESAAISQPIIGDAAPPRRHDGLAATQETINGDKIDEDILRR